MLLLHVYIAAFVLGACLLCASMFLGHHDTDPDVDVDLDVDGHAEANAGDPPVGRVVGLGDFWMPFVNVRFWIFFLCSFGLTGALFVLLGLAGPWQTLLRALGVGLVTGLAAVVVIRHLRKH